MKHNSFISFIIKNRYSVIGAAIVIVIFACGWILKLVELVATLALIWFAIYLGKRIQEDENFIQDKINKCMGKDSGEKEDE